MDGAPVYKLADLASLYQSRLEQHGLKKVRVHSIHLKERLINDFPNLKHIVQVEICYWRILIEVNKPVTKLLYKYS